MTFSPVPPSRLSVLIGLVANFDNGKLGGEVIPLNFSNGGFTWGWNDSNPKATAEVKEKVNAKLAEFQKTPELVSNWSSVDYSKL